MRVAAYSARPPRLASRVRTLHLPAPVLGIDAVNPASALDARHALLLLNVVSGNRGLTPRPGWQEHATNVGAGEVRSVVPYHSSGALDRLFATAQAGIYDVTSGGAAPALVHTFATQNATSGFGEALAFVNAAGSHYLLYADEANGYLLYTEASDSWAAGSVTGVDPGALVSVTRWGSRVWLTERDSTRAWYLPVGAISGVATVFDFGPFFTSGGTLRGLWRWTRDGGAGMDDLLVAVSSGGDVVVFTGGDPLGASFALVGVWNVGGVPAGRRLMSAYGGDLQLLTLHGQLSLSRLVSGRAQTPDTYETDAIRPLFAEAMSLASTRNGWHATAHPRGAFLLVNIPAYGGISQEQFAMSYATRAWSVLRGLDILSSNVWQGEFYFGTRDGRVLRSTGYLDDVRLGGDTTHATAVECAALGGFAAGGATRKIVRFFRPVFLTHGLSPSFEPYVRFDYDTSELSGSLAAATPSAGAWDSGVWDSALWGGLLGKSYQRAGVAGVGTAVAVGVRFLAQDYCVLVGYDVGVEEGGVL